MKKIDRLLAKFLAATVILFAVSLVFSKKEKNAPKAVQSAILNQKYKNEVSEIEIAKNGGQGSDKITLKKMGDFWLLTAQDKTNGREFCTIAEVKIVTSFLKNCAKLRSMYTISDRISEYNLFSVDENNGTIVSFLLGDGIMCTKVYFGAVNPLKNRIYLRSESISTVWECENDFQQFLTTDSNYWLAGELLPEITNPVSLIFTENGKTLSLDEKSDGFSAKARTLLSLRHGAVRSEEISHDAELEDGVETAESFANGAELSDRTENAESFVSNIAVATLTVQDGNGRLARIEFFEEQDSDGKEGEESYFYTKSVTPSEIDSPETRFALYAEQAAYEISAWTFERVRNVLISR